MDPIGDEILPPSYLRDYNKLGECKVCFFLEHVAEAGIVYMVVFLQWHLFFCLGWDIKVDAKIVAGNFVSDFPITHCLRVGNI